MYIALERISLYIVIDRLHFDIYLLNNTRKKYMEREKGEISKKHKKTNDTYLKFSCNFEEVSAEKNM